MEKTTDGTVNELLIRQAYSGIEKNSVTGKSRVVIGSFENCDIVISHDSVSPIHCVLEYDGEQVSIFDLNSNHGTFYKNKAIVAEQIPLNSTFFVGKVELTIKEAEAVDAAPPIIAPIPDAAAEPPKLVSDPPTVQTQAPPVENIPPKKVATPSKSVRAKVEPLPKMPALEVKDTDITVAHPLSRLENAEFSEYIFEDASRVKPVFSSKPTQTAFEVTVLYKDRVFSVDYLPKNFQGYSFVGVNRGKDYELTFPYFGKKENIEFIRFFNSETQIVPLSGYSTYHLHRNKVETYRPLEINGTLEFEENDIVQFFHDDIKIFIRSSLGTPRLLTPPIFETDRQLLKYLLFIFLLVGLFLLAMSTFEVDEELKKDKAPDRIATILYKQPIKKTRKKTIDKSQKQIKKQQKVKKMNNKTVKAKTRTSSKKEISAKKTTPEGLKTATKKAISKQKTSTKKMTTKTPKLATSKTAGGNNVSGSRSVRSKSISTKTKGHVDTYKRPNFNSRLSRLLSKGGVSKANIKLSKDSSTAGKSVSVVGGDSETSLKTAKVNNNVGTLNGETRGRIAVSKGSQGLSAKKTFLTAGIPTDTVVLGSMDPDVIRRILREHIPQFRYCYQRELDSASKKIQGAVKLDFVIGASGNVTNASVESRLNRKIKSCVARVLRGIQFPEPLGGGVVEVSQPINFYPKRI